MNHTGPLTWDQRAWAAVLYAWPAALALESALPKPSPQGPIHVAVGLGRTLKPVPGVVFHRTASLRDRTHPTHAPPRMTIEHAAIDVALGKRDLAGRFQVFADACQTRKTTAARITAALRTRHGIADKQLLLDLLDDLEHGANSVLRTTARPPRGQAAGRRPRSMGRASTAMRRTTSSGWRWSWTVVAKKKTAPRQRRLS